MPVLFDVSSRCVLKDCMIDEEGAGSDDLSSNAMNCSFVVSVGCIACEREHFVCQLVVGRLGTTPTRNQKEKRRRFNDLPIATPIHCQRQLQPRSHSHSHSQLPTPIPSHQSNNESQPPQYHQHHRAESSQVADCRLSRFRLGESNQANP